MIEDNSDILIFGAAENNLKHINVRIPLNQITCVTGKSGSGKSSLVKGVIAQESQRLQSIVAGFASEFERYVRADFSHIRNLPNSVFIKQEQAMRTVNSSVATYSGLSDGLRKLFANEGEIVCRCGQVVDNVVDKDKIIVVLEQLLGDKTYLFYSLISKNTPIDIAVLKRFRTEYSVDNFIIDDNHKPLDINAISKLSKHKKFSVKALIGIAAKSNLASLQLARFSVKSLQVYDAETCLFYFKHHTFCYHCFSPYRSKSTSLFTRKQLSRDSGACLTCSGIGSQKAIDFPSLINSDRLITDIEFLNLANNGKAYKYVNLQNSYMSRFAKENAIDTSLIFKQMSKAEHAKTFSFLASKFENYLDHDRLQEFITENNCSDCHGSGFNHYSLSVIYNKKTIADVLKLSISEALLFFAEADFKPILSALNKLALGHLALDRRTNTLSGGELQRLKLVEVIIQKTEPLLLIIDEPSVGLHHNDLNNLLSLFRDLVSQKNTLLVIDHHPWIIANCDHHIEIGPGSGAQGGMLVTPDKIRKKPAKSWVTKPTQQLSKMVSFEDINYHNIVRQRVVFPSHQLVCLVGVSGSGKSSLAQYIAKNGQGHFDEVISLSQYSIGKNKRSTIATYLGVADDIRAIYAATERSKFLSLNKSDFNSTVQSGVCKACVGLEQAGDVLCSCCTDQSFNPFILSITIDEINISEFLQVPIDELEEAAPNLFSHKNLHKALITLIEIGLGHLSLGREIPSISGGEAQRVKLAKYLTQYNNSITDTNKHNLLILDEPSQGLNSADSLAVLELLNKLVACQNSLLVIEHNDEILERADFIIELGPQAGHLGGQVIFVGSAEDFFSQRPNYNLVKKNAVQSVAPAELYPSAVANNQVDTSHFDTLEQIFSSYRLISLESRVLHFCDKQKMHLYYLSKLPASRLFFNPFNSFFVNSPFVSREDIEITLLRLQKFMLDGISVAGSAVNLRQAYKLIDNKNCWSVLVEINDFNLAFELGGGWVVAQSQDVFWHLSVPMLSLQEKIFSPKKIVKNSFNLIYNKCQYCDGEGEVDFSDAYVSDPNLSILDIGFYHGDFAQVMKSKLLRKLKSVVSTFSQQGLFDLTRSFNKLTQQELTIYQQGLPMHHFLRKGGRDTAKGDIIAWPGMTRFFLDNIKYFSAQSKQQFVASLIRKQCKACGGSGCNKRLNYYLTKMHNQV